MEDFELELKYVFLGEAAQILTEAEQCYLAFETDPSNQTLLDKVFRLAHNLKGSSKAAGFEDIGTFTHELESFLYKLKSHVVENSHECISLLLRCNDRLVKMVESLRADLSLRFDCSDLVAELQGDVAAATDRQDQADVPVHQEAEPQLTLWNEAPEKEEPAPRPQPKSSLSVAQPAPAAAPAPGIASAVAPASSAAVDDNIRISLSRLESLINFVGEAVILQTVLKEQTHGVENPLLRKTVQQIGKVTKEIQDISMNLRMVPIKQNFLKMQRIVRDTAAQLQKQVILVMQGEETEVDKTILEKISDPLVHLIRNSMDHGIEVPQKRLAAGKREQGIIKLNAFHKGGKLVIEVMDDGGGIDTGVVRAKAIEKGLIREDTVLSEQETLALIFKPGFSTKTVVTDVSGRGVGMDVVKTNIEDLHGEVLLTTTKGSGSCFTIILPLTLAIIDGLIVQVADQRFVLPLASVHETLRLKPGDVHHSTPLHDVLMLRGENIPLYAMSRLLGMDAKRVADQDSIAIVMRDSEIPFAVVVDDIHTQSQIVIKKLGNEHRNLSGVSGSAILGDGKAALILEPADLVKRSGSRNMPNKSLRRVA
ncbi:chemotaxis protein CheA [Oligoflexus tunisiensis]|uniref:chemotaxis protein CheA n=1 Tax=Oligoflexus tunisiensis TaxID=708132 RepID=UPI000AFCAB62|nr:chemotaxis protein CheA [Oligoflexus tunisiensis]